MASLLVGPFPARADVADAGPCVISFAADGAIAVSGALVAGRAAMIRYPPERLPTCRGTYESLPAWAIVASWTVDGGAIASAPVALPTATSVARDVEFTVPPGADLEVWFHNTDALGCSAWDSDYGRNFHFAISPAAP